jgi:hypothetical protein
MVVAAHVVACNWRDGPREQARVTWSDGRGCVVTWREPPGAGPFRLLFAALHLVFPDWRAPSWPKGFTALSDAGRLAVGMKQAGFADVTAQQIEGVCEGPVGDAYLSETHELYQYIRPYVAQDDDARSKVDDALRELTMAASSGSTMRLASPVLIAVGSRF